MVERIQRGSETLSYISSPDGLVAMHISDDNGRDEMKYVLTDYLGSIYALVDDGAQSTDDALYYSFNAWGEGRELQAYDGSLTAPLFSDPADYITSRGYTGHEHIDAFDLINMNGRVYDPNTSSFLSPDPVMQSPENPQNLNRYSYCLNNPTKYIDPSGFTQQKPPRQEWLENNYGFEGGSYFYRGQQFFYDSEKGGFNGNMGGYHSGNNASGYSTAGIHSNESSSTGYINRYGEEVPFDYVYDHVIEPNSNNYYGANALNQLRDIAQNSMTMDFPSDFYSSNVSMDGNIYMVTSKNPIGNYRIKYGGIIFPRGCSTHIVGPVIMGSDVRFSMHDASLATTAFFLTTSRMDPLIQWGMREGSDWGRLGSRISGAFRSIGIAGYTIGMGFSIYNMANDYSEGGIAAISPLYVGDFAVGAAGLYATIFLASNPVGWVIAGGATLYFGARFIYDISTKP